MRPGRPGRRQPVDLRVGEVVRLVDVGKGAAEGIIQERGRLGLRPSIELQEVPRIEAAVRLARRAVGLADGERNLDPFDGDHQGPRIERQQVRSIGAQVSVIEPVDPFLRHQDLVAGRARGGGNDCGRRARRGRVRRRRTRGGRRAGRRRRRLPRAHAVALPLLVVDEALAIGLLEERVGAEPSGLEGLAAGQREADLRPDPREVARLTLARVVQDRREEDLDVPLFPEVPDRPETDGRGRELGGPAEDRLVSGELVPVAPLLAFLQAIPNAQPRHGGYVNTVDRLGGDRQDLELGDAALRDRDEQDAQRQHRLAGAAGEAEALDAWDDVRAVGSRLELRPACRQIERNDARRIAGG